MITATTYHGAAPAGSIVVRIVHAGPELAGFVTEVNELDEEDTIYPTEQQPLDEVWRLVENKFEQNPDVAILIDMEAGIEWNPRWGELDPDQSQSPMPATRDA